MDASLQGKTYVVTGATAGIGLAAAGILAGRGAFVIGVGRSEERCRQAEGQLKSAHPQARVVYCRADLASQSEIRHLATELRRLLVAHKARSLDGLINDAGTFTFRRSLTPDGFETQWAVNHLAPFLLTHELLPLLKIAPAARLVTVSSNSHFRAHMSWSDLQLQHGYNGWRAYQQSKLANLLFTAELRRRLGPDSTVRAFAADPGLVQTDIGAKGTPGLVGWAWRRWAARGAPPEQSARGVVFLATEPTIRDRPEIYWKDCQPKLPGPSARDEKAARRLWELSEQMCGIPAGTYTE